MEVADYGSPHGLAFYLYFANLPIFSNLFQNSEGERKKSFGEIITEDFQRRYASKVIELANINRDLNEHIRNIQDFTQQVCCIVFATGAWTGYALGS